MALSVRHDPRTTSPRLPSLPRLPRIDVGLPLLLAGVALVVFALSRSFYVVKLPAALLQQVFGGVQDPALQQFGQQLAAELARQNAAGGIGVSGWEAFTRIDVVVVGLCVLAAAVVVLRRAGQVAAPVAAWAWAGGLVPAALVGYRMLRAAGPADAAAYISVAGGAWLVLAGTVAVTVGAFLAVRRN